MGSFLSNETKETNSPRTVVCGLDQYQALINEPPALISIEYKSI